MLQNEENIAVRSLQILYIFVLLRAEKITTFQPKVHIFEYFISMT